MTTPKVVFTQVPELGGVPTIAKLFANLRKARATTRGCLRFVKSLTRSKDGHQRHP